MESNSPIEKVVFVFLDGVGVAGGHETNPFSSVDLPFLSNLTGGPLTIEHAGSGPGFVFKGIDACLGVDGIPQSATGQTALFSGINAPALLGYHFPAFPNRACREILKTHNLFSSAISAGRTATFANAYSPAYFRLVREGKRKHSVTTVSVLASGLPFRTLGDLAEGRAVTWDITNRYLVETHNVNIALCSPEAAATHLCSLLDENDLVVFESFRTDMIGHSRSHDDAVAFLRLLDRFAAGIAGAMTPATTLVISSDHGNIEDLGTGGHTRNPSILLATGRSAMVFDEVDAITGVKDAIMRILSVRR